jgi:GMP synthase-like glutamine amidotransferase
MSNHSKKKILILQHCEDVHLGSLQALLEQYEVPFEKIDLFKTNSLPSFSLETLHQKYRSLLSLGGTMSAINDSTDEKKYPWILDEIKLMQNFLELNLPLIGICLGGQLLARAIGGQVMRNTIPEMGWTPLSLTEQGEADPLFKTLIQHQPYLYQWHDDAFTLPSIATLLASSHDCQNQAFKLNNHVYGFQFHPEANAELVKLWAGTSTELLTQHLEETKKFESTCSAFNSKLVKILTTS